MADEAPEVEHITEDGEQDASKEKAPDTRTDEEILAAGSKEDEKEEVKPLDVDSIVPADKEEKEE